MATRSSSRPRPAALASKLAKIVPTTETQLKFDYGREDFASVPFPERLSIYPELRYMGSKHRLLPWIHGVLRTLPFETAADPFVGSGCVAYLLKSMGKGVVASDFLNFPTVLAAATVGNSKERPGRSCGQEATCPAQQRPPFYREDLCWHLLHA